ncbi:hypothetical protein NPIL_635921 [Nephila pilipes]|uniref:Uncharacterized protein n=1 Tax=Nephila pilipes TaxID=299642 RepID=A0A8X6IQ35_NEPPI|nr:hypothetical protein NPIL_635921 [Nephila pilipes]
MQTDSENTRERRSGARSEHDQTTRRRSTEEVLPRRFYSLSENVSKIQHRICKTVNYSCLFYLMLVFYWNLNSNEERNIQFNNNKVTF